MNGTFGFAALTAALLLSLPCAFGQHVAPAAAQKNVVFQIGQFDRSSAEFSGDTPHQPVDFVVGKSIAKKDWYAVQPAVLTSASASSVATSAAPGAAASTPWKITFTLGSAPARWYTLHIAVLIDTPSVPAFRVGINRKHGMFYLHPKLDLTAGDDGSSPICSHADVVFDFPGSYLHQGTNVISLQSIEEAAQETPDAGIYYDAIALGRSSAAHRESTSSARIVPTIFYREDQGKLNELVNVFIRFAERPQPGSKVDLTIDGNRYRQTVAGNQDFGEAQFKFQAAEFAPRAKADLSWVAAGHRRHLQETIEPQKKWTLFLVPHIHLDIGYTDYQPKVAAIQSRVLDEAMDFTAQHPDFRFSTDGEWNLEQFLKTRTPTENQRVITAIQKKQIFIPAQYANLLTGFSTAETLIRSLYPSANFSRLHGTPFNYANITDVPSFSWSYASILASAGIKDFISGSNNGRAPVLLEGRLQYKSPMWWEGPDGKKALFWYSHDYSQMESLFGQPPIVAAGRDMLPLFLQMYDHPDYRANAAIIYGTQWENTDLFPQQAALASGWNAIYAYPRLQYSGFHAALENIARQFGGDLPTVRGDGGPYWEDGVASDAYYAAMERGNESRGPSAEKLETVTSLINPGIAADKAGLHRMWRNMVLMDEHTFTSYNSISQPRSQLAIRQLKVKDQHAVNAQALADWLARSSMASIVNSIYAGQNSLVVFNTLNWRRSGFVSVDIPDGTEVADVATGQTVPYATIFSGQGFRHVCFLAEQVPAVGYKVYLLRKAAHPEEVPATGTSATMESPYYRVELDPATGAVKSIYDKQLHRELVNQSSPYRFGEYLYVTGGDRGPNSLLEYRPISPKPVLTVHTAHSGSLVSITRTPWGWTARMTSVDTNTPRIQTEIRLFSGEKKIEFIEDVDKRAVTAKEGVYFAFPFSMDHPQFHYEIQNGVVDPATDMYPGAGHEWFSVQHWASVEENGASGTVMPLDAGLITLGDINRGMWPASFGTRPGTIFSYVMNNYWNTNYVAAQGGHFRFRYVVTSAASTEPATLSRMGWEEVTPLETDEVTSQDKALNTPRPLSGKQASFLTIDDPDVVLDTWKPAEDGNGTILRLIDLGGAERTITVRTPLLNLTQSWLTDAVERNQKQLPLMGTNGFSFTIHPHEIVTLRLVGKSTIH